MILDESSHKNSKEYGIAGIVPNRNNQAPNSSSDSKCFHVKSGEGLGSSKALTNAQDPTVLKTPDITHKIHVAAESMSGSVPPSVTNIGWYTCTKGTTEIKVANKDPHTNHLKRHNIHELFE